MNASGSDRLAANSSPSSASDQRIKGISNNTETRDEILVLEAKPDWRRVMVRPDCPGRGRLRCSKRRTRHRRVHETLEQVVASLALRCVESPEHDGELFEFSPGELLE